MEKGKKKILTCLMVVITLLMVFPFVWMLMLSFKTSGEIMSNPLALPASLNLNNYINSVNTLNFFQLYGNTFLVCILSLCIEL